jgi:hypothetical protein
MDKAKHTAIIAETIAQMKKRGVDAYLIITSEGSDPMTRYLLGVGTVGDGAFLFTAGGKKIAVCSKIDAQDIEESGLFDEVRKYDEYSETLAALVREINPVRLALNCSPDDPFCDGLTVGRYRKFRNSAAELTFEEISAAEFMGAVREKYR